MNERSFYPKFKTWIAEHQPEDTCTFEIKFLNYSKNKSFAFNRVEEHQVLNLMTSLEGLYVRIADQPYVNNGYQQKKPFDSVLIKAKDAFVVIVFWNPRKWTVGFLVPVEDFVKMKDSSVKKSISFDELSEKYQGIFF